MARNHEREQQAAHVAELERQWVNAVERHGRLLDVDRNLNLQFQVATGGRPTFVTSDTPGSIRRVVAEKQKLEPETRKASVEVNDLKSRLDRARERLADLDRQLAEEVD
jgi:chromosome segregation ATPase